MTTLSKFFIRRKPSPRPPSSTGTDFSSPSPADTKTININNDNGVQAPPLSAKPRSSKTRKARGLALIINRNPWSDDLQSSLPPSLSSISKTTFLQTIRLIKNPLKSLQFFNWVRSNGFPLDSQSLLSILEILGSNRCLNAARNLLFSLSRRPTFSLEARHFNSLISSYGRAGLFKESIKMFSVMKSMGVSPSTVTFNTLLSILLRRGRTVMAHQLYEEMLKTYGVNPDVFTFNILIRGFCMNSMVDQGFRVFNEMSRFQCEPDVITYNTLVDGLCRDGKVEIARNLVKGMGKRGLDLGPTVVTYTTLIRGFCKKKGIQEAIGMFEEMVSRGIKPTKITYNTLIQGLCEAEQIDKIRELAERTMGDGEFAPDTCTFNTLMNAHCKAGKLDAAMSLFDKFLDLQVRPDSASYSILIRGLCERGDFGKAEDLLDELVEKEVLVCEEGSEPLVAAYNPIFEYLCANGKTRKAEKVFRQLMKRGVPDPLSYRMLIMGHCREGFFVDGYDLLVLMLRRDLLPDFEMYRSLIEGLLQKAEPILAYKTLLMTLKSKFLPKASVFHSVLSELVKTSHASECAALVTIMLEKEVRQNINLSTETVILLYKTGQRDNAFKMLKSLYQNGYVVKLDELVSFLCKSNKLLDTRDLLLFSLENHGEVDFETFDTVITGLCKGQKLFEAFSLYYELVEKGVHEQLKCQESLKSSLVVGGRSKEAEFVSKRMSTQCSPDQILSKAKLNRSSKLAEPWSLFVSPDDTIITPVQCKSLWRKFNAETEYTVTQAISAQEAYKKSNNWLPPPWAIAAMVILGFNEFMMLLKNPFYNSTSLHCL